MVGLIVGLLIARVMFNTVAEKLAPALGSSVTFAQIVSFLIIWIAVPIGLSILASLLTKAMDGINIGWINRLLGTALGGVKYILIIGIVIHVINYIDPHNHIISETKKKDSALYYPMDKISTLFFPLAKDFTKQIIK